MSKIYNIPLGCHFFKELAQIVENEKDLAKLFLPNNRSCRALKKELSKYNCIAPEIISISEFLNFPDINFLLLKFLRDNTSTIPFNTLFDLAASLSTLIRNLIFNKADYRKLLVPEKFNETWKSSLAILDQVFQTPEILKFKRSFESRLDKFFSSLDGERIAVAGLLEENFYNRLLYSKALDSGFVVVSGLANKSGENFKKINRLIQNESPLQIENRGSQSKNRADRKFLELSNNSDEALAIALAVRKMVDLNKSILIVCSNLSLTQKIKLELLKWNIVADDSSGTALHRTVCGQIISQIISVIENDFRNSDVINLLKFNNAVKKSVMDLENFLRKKENYPLNFFKTFEMFSPPKNANGPKSDFKTPESIGPLFDIQTYREGASNPFLVQSDEEIFSGTDQNSDSEDEKSPFEILAEIVDQLKEFSEFPKTADFNFWLDYFSNFINLVNHSAAEEFSQILQNQDFENLSLSEFCIFLKNHCLDKSLRQNIGYTPGVVILGILESQLVDADLIIIGGANENSWKSSSANDFWMSDSMLKQLGINTVDERNEFYACVWEKLISKPNVLVTRSVTENGEQAQSYSRLKNCELKQDVSLENLVYAVKSPSDFSPIHFEAPNPPADYRPTTFWVSDLDLLIGNPYVYYAKKILRLKEMNPINSRRNLKGNLIHEIFDNFAKKKILNNKLSSLKSLFVKVCREKFVNLEFLGLWYFNVDSIFKFFTEHFNSNAKNFSEISGHIDLKISNEDRSVQVKIASKADRLEINSDGAISIVDYKTGEIPSLKKVKDGEKIQLPVEALIATKNGFKLGKTTVEKMSFWQMKPRKTKISDVSQTSEETAQICEDVLAEIEDLMKNYLLLEKPYEINRDDKYNKLYMQLARVREI
jgi:ATP-dependent helicase/nuclease subunit B